jgi:ATP-dependent DNA helicase RecQ
MDQYGALKIMQELAKPVLKGQQQVWLRQDIQYQRTKANKTSSKSSLKTFANPADEALWQALKAKRSELAKLHSVQPYVIFHDSTLLEMVQKKPSHIAQMRTISGIGEAKLARYGEQFVALIQSLDNADIDPAS